MTTNAGYASTTAARLAPRQAWTLVVILTLAYAVSFLDRTVLVLLLQPIKEHYGVSDTQLGLLHGFGFVMFYLLLGLPIGRWVDRYSRRAIVATGTLVWSVMTAACGLAPNFFWLVAARLGVGAGEASLGPAAFSLIGDALPADEQPRALSVYSMGISLGSGLALIAGGWLIGSLQSHDLSAWPVIGKLAPWQLVFMVASLPGILIAGLMMLSPEPARQNVRRSELTAGGRIAAVPMREVVNYIRAHRYAYLGIIGGFSLLVMAGFGVSTWIPTFLLRTYGASMSEVGIVYGLISIFAGLAGAASAGQLAAVLTRRGWRDALILTAVIEITGVLIGSLFTLAPTLNLAFAWLAVFSFFNGMPFGTAAAALNQMTPNQLRGQLSALFHLCLSLIGVGLGPLAVGMLTDKVFAAPDGVRYSILLTCAIGMPSVVIGLLFTRRSFIAARDGAERWAQS